MSLIHITIDGHTFAVEEGTSLLAAATQNGLNIPHLCFDERVALYGACGLCVVEVEGTAKLLRACSTKATDGMVVHTDTERVTRARKVALELLLSDHDGDCKAPCTKACPANTDCQGYVALIANGEYNEATRVIKEKIPVPASIGRVCPHPCESKCRRQFVDEPVSIAALKGFAADMDMASVNPYVPPVEPDTGKTVAVVGGGPGGLTAAYFLRRQGHSVTIFDAMPKMGGMLRYGIPEYRLPKAILDREIDQIEAIGVKLCNNVKIGKDKTLEDLRKDYDAVVLAAGAWSSSKMRVPGEDIPGVLGGIDFLRAVALGEAPAIGNAVAVVGGGNTAMDACRTAVRLGAKDVFVIYRRTRAEMPAEEAEIVESEEEGVQYRFLTSPIEFTEENGKVRAVLQKMRLGEPDASGRRRPEPIEGETETLLFDTVIMAIGQHPDLTGFESVETTARHTVAADEETFRTSLDGVFAVGDMTNKGASIAIAAIGEAQKASVIVDRYLAGEAARYKKPFYVERDLPPEFFSKFPKAPRAKMPQRPAEERKHDFGEVALGFSEEVSRKEAMRCLECGCHDYYECKLIEYANQCDVKPERFAGEKHHRNEEDVNSLISRNTDKCILCGLCVRVCEEAMGKTNLGLIGRGFDTIVSPEFSLPLEESSCMFCGQCVTVCPTGALREKQPVKKRLTLPENSVQSVCTDCSALCKTDVRFIGKTVTRVLPAGEKGLLCKAGRFGIFEAAEEKQPISDEAFAEIRAKLSEYGDSAAVVFGPTASLEEMAFAKAHFQAVYADVTEKSAAFAGAKLLEIPSVKAYRGEKAVVLVDCKLPADFAPEYTVALSHAEAQNASAQVFTAPFTAEGGTYLKADGSVRTAQAAIKSALPTKLSALAALCGETVSPEEMTKALRKTYSVLANPKDSAIIETELLRIGGGYFQNRTSEEIARFCDKFQSYFPFTGFPAYRAGNEKGTRCKSVTAPATVMPTSCHFATGSPREGGSGGLRQSQETCPQMMQKFFRWERSMQRKTGVETLPFFCLCIGRSSSKASPFFAGKEAFSKNKTTRIFRQINK